VGTVTRDAARALSPDDGTHQDVVLDQFVLVCRARANGVNLPASLAAASSLKVVTGLKSRLSA